MRKTQTQTGKHARKLTFWERRAERRAAKADRPARVAEAIAKEFGR